jgi:ABC-type bacteriocin/lantibiotic exporter with double-glycine peptidase domain
VAQLEPAESAAACLGMVLAWYGRWVPLEELRLACGVTRDGSKASNVLKAARGYGLAAKGFRKPADALETLPVPSIIHWDFKHFVVFEGFQGDRASLHDPAQGRRLVSRREFVEKYTGVVLALEPTPAFRRGGPRPRVWRPLLGLLGRSRATLVLVALFSVLLVLPGVLLPGLAKLFVDKVLADHLDDWLLPLVAAVAAAGMFQALLVWLQDSTLRRLEARLSASLAARVMARMLALPMAFLGQRAAADGGL